MAKAKPPHGGGNKQPGAGAAPPRPGTKPVPEIKLPPGDSPRDFESIAELIAADPPAWLAEQLCRWAASVLLDQAVQKHQPSRGDMRTSLVEVKNAAKVLLRALGTPAVCEFLEPRAIGPIPTLGDLQRMLIDLDDRAERGSQSPALVNAQGKTKAGTGRAVPEGAISPQVYCALMIAEAWKHFRGDYPGSRKVEAARAAEDFWRLTGCERQSWSDKPLNAWRRHFEAAETADQDELRGEYIRHLNESAAQAAALEPEPHPEQGT
jgi:hypothetical protein